MGSYQVLGVVLADVGESNVGEPDAAWCDNCATVSPVEIDFLYEIRGDGQTGFRSENPRVGGLIPPLRTGSS